MSAEPVPAELLLPAHGTSTGEARRFVSGVLDELGLPHLAETAELAVSELVTNAVLHTRTPVDLHVAVDDQRVRIDVGDQSADLPVLRSYGRLATTGRGLALVTALVEELGVEPRENGKTVWFTLARVPVAAADEPPFQDEDLADLLDLWDLEEDEGVPVAEPGIALLVDLPVALWEAAHQHHDAVLRELVLHRGSRLGDQPSDWAWYAAADTAHTTLSAAVERAVAAAVVADEALPPVVTVRVALLGPLQDQLTALVQALDDADELAAQGRLLVDPAGPDVIALRTWCRREVDRQTRGTPPSPWPGWPLP